VVGRTGVVSAVGPFWSYVGPSIPPSGPLWSHPGPAQALGPVREGQYVRGFFALPNPPVVDKI
jgi:hypothetical protein